LQKCGDESTQAAVNRVQHQKSTGRETLVKIQCRQELAALQDENPAEPATTSQNNLRTGV